MNWTVKIDLIEDWLDEQDEGVRADVAIAIERLETHGPTLGRPWVDRIQGSCIHNLKELRPAAEPGMEVRILFVFDPLRRAILLVAGDKASGKSNARKWNGWYRSAIPRAERTYAKYLEKEGL